MNRIETPVTVVWLGAMGRALAGAFLAAGHPTTVWNRTPGRADDLVARGATLASTPAAAVEASPLVVVCVVDDAAAHELLDPVASRLAGRTLVNLSSDTPERARATAAWAAEQGCHYLDGAIMVPTVVVGTAEAVILVSGPHDVFDAHRATLQALAGNLHHLGDDPGAAALHDVAMLDVFYSTMAGLVHAFALAGADGVAPTAFAPFAGSIVGILPPIIAAMAKAIETGDHPGDTDRLAMEAAGIGHVLEASEARDLDVGVLQAVKSLADRAVAAGHGDDSFSSIAEVLRPLPTP